MHQSKFSLTIWLLDFPNKIPIDIHHSLTNSLALLIGRIIALLILSFRYYFSFLTYHSSFQIVEYFTQFGYALTWIYFLTVNQHYLLQKCKPYRGLVRLGDWMGLMFQVCICTQVVVTVLFWAVLYNYSKPFVIIDFFKEVGVHGFPFICLLYDLFFNIYQFVPRHLIVTLLIGLLYLFINLGYSLAIQPIYAPLDWVSVMCYVYLISCIILVISFHTIIRKYWQKYRRPKLLPKIQEDIESYIKMQNL